MSNGRTLAYLSLVTLTVAWTIPFDLKALGFTLQSDKKYYIGLGPHLLWALACIPTFMASAWFTLGNLGNEFGAEDKQTSGLRKAIAVLLVLGTVGALPGFYFASRC